MATNQWTWMTESTPAQTTLGPPPALTAIQPPATITGPMVEPYAYPVPPLATPTPPPGVSAPARGPQTPPMGPFGPGAGGMGAPGLATTSLPAGTHGTAYTATLTAGQGGTAPFTFTAAPLPAGLTLSGATISGDPTAAGTTQVVITVTDSKGATSAPVTLPLVIA